MSSVDDRTLAGDAMVASLLLGLVILLMEATTMETILVGAGIDGGAESRGEGFVAGRGTAYGVGAKKQQIKNKGFELSINRLHFFTISAAHYPPSLSPSQTLSWLRRTQLRNLRGFVSNKVISIRSIRKLRSGSPHHV